MSAKQMRILLIVPELGFQLSPEVDSLYPQGFYVQSIAGYVTRERIMANIQKREFDIIHYAGDSGPEGIRLSNAPDGSVCIMDAATLVQIARAVKAKLVFLNGCSSVIVGQTLIDEHIAYVVCTLSGIDNVMARETSQLFYQALAETDDIRTAFDMSKPPTKGAYVILTNGVKDVSLKPILDKMAVFDMFIARNDAEHAQIIASIEVNKRERETDTVQIRYLFHRSRIWSAIIMLAGMVGVGFIVGIFSLVARGVP